MFKSTRSLIHQRQFFWLVLLGFIFLNSSLVLAAPKEIGRVLMATTGVTAQQPEAEARVLKRRSVVYEGDTIQTPVGGKAQVRLNDGELIALMASTVLQLDQFSYQPGAKDTPDSNMKTLVTGGLRSITGAVGGDAYQVQTKVGTIGIRGTAYEAYTDRGLYLFVKMLNGAVIVRNEAGELEIAAGDSLDAAYIESATTSPQAIPATAVPNEVQESFTETSDLSAAEGSHTAQPLAVNNETPAIEPPEIYSAITLDIDIDLDTSNLNFILDTLDESDVYAKFDLNFLTENDLVNLVNSGVLANSSYEFYLGEGYPSIEGAGFSVDFLQGDMNGYIVFMGDGDYVFEGSIKDFYSKGLNVHNYTDSRGSLTGRFVGKEADSALVEYDYLGSKDILIFDRN